MLKFNTLFFFLGMTFFSSSFAIIDLELTQGKSSATPIGILPFANENQALAAGNQTVSDIIRNDLQNSGEFKAKTTAVGVDDIVSGEVKPLSNGKYEVSFQLKSAYKTAGNNALLATESVTVDQAGMRSAAHYMADVIYQKLTGVQGIFSTRIAYVLVNRNSAGVPIKYSLEVADADGFNPRPLLTSAQPIMSPTWSADGRSIAYVSFEGPQPSIYLQNVASGQRSLLSQYPGINGAPAFAPNNRQLAMVLTLSGNPKIYTMSLGGGRPTQLTKGYAIDTEPSWSPDGRNLIYTSDSGGNPQIYRYDLSTGQNERLTFDGDYNARASYLPNAKGMVLMHRNRAGEAFGIARQDFDTGRIQILTQATGDESPSLSPNGKMVIYATQYAGKGVLALVSTDGRIKLRLPERDGSVQEPAWSPIIR